MYKISANLVHRELRNAAFEGGKMATLITMPDSVPYGVVKVEGVADDPQEVHLVAPVVPGSVLQSRLPSKLAFQCCKLPQLLNTQQNVPFHLNLHFNLQF